MATQGDAAVSKGDARAEALADGVAGATVEAAARAA